MGLPEAYRETNELYGHARNCAYGAGADCTCGKFNIDGGHARNCGWGMQEDCTCDKRPIFWLYGELALIRNQRDHEAALKLALEGDRPF